jgi:hypothetical protein
MLSQRNAANGGWFAGGIPRRWQKFFENECSSDSSGRARIFFERQPENGPPRKGNDDGFIVSPSSSCSAAFPTERARTRRCGTSPRRAGKWLSSAIPPPNPGSRTRPDSAWTIAAPNEIFPQRAGRRQGESARRFGIAACPSDGSCPAGGAGARTTLLAFGTVEPWAPPVENLILVTHQMQAFKPMLIPGTLILSSPRGLAPFR